MEGVAEKGNRYIYFKGFTPQESELEYFTSNRGYLVAKIIGHSEVIFDSGDILNAHATAINDKAFINVQLSKSAGEKLMEVTSFNLGKQLLITLDDKVILHAKIDQPIGRHFRLSSESVKHASEQALLLRFGHLQEPLVLHKVN